MWKPRARRRPWLEYANPPVVRNTNNTYDVRIARLPKAQRKRVKEFLRLAEAEVEEDFVERVHALPPEIFDAVYNLTFASTPNSVAIEDSFKWPTVARVSRSSRRLFLTTFLSSTVFWVSDWDTVGRWLKAMPKDDRKAIAEVRVKHGKEVALRSYGGSVSEKRVMIQKRRNLLNRELNTKFGVYLTDRQLYFQMDYEWVNCAAVINAKD